MKKFGKVLGMILAIIFIIVAGFSVYWNSNSYYLDENFRVIDNDLKIEENKKYNYYDAKSEIGIIFYPGANVDYDAYSPLVYELYKSGYNVALIKSPLRLSVLQPNTALDVIAEKPEIKKWVLMGHSLGGTTASQIAEMEIETIKGIVFLGSYPYKVLSTVNIQGLSIYGSDDGILNLENFEKAKEFLPKDTELMEIDGGNHSFFGFYGLQKGDGHGMVKRKFQVEETIKKISEFIDTKIK